MTKLQLSGTPIVYYVSGNSHKEWVLFLHAAFADHSMFDAQIAHFQNHYNVISLDIIGHGESVRTKKGDGIGKMSQWICRILREQKVDAVHIVGVSLGSVLAQDFANHYPRQVQSLTCIGGYDINNFDAKLQQENGTAQMLMMMKAFVSIRWFAEANKKISAHTPKAQADFYEMNIRFPKKSFMYLAGLNGMVNVHKPEPKAYPLLIGCGEYDIPAAHTAVKMWGETEPNAYVVVLEGAGHCANMDVPDAFNRTLQLFFENGKL